MYTIIKEPCGAEILQKKLQKPLTNEIICGKIEIPRMGFIFLCLFLNSAGGSLPIKTHNSVDEGGNNAHMGKKIGGAESES